MAERTNQEWLEELRGPNPDQAITALNARLVRGLRAAMSDKNNVAEADIQDFAQDAVLKILDSLDSFRGESRFTTWAQKIAVRVALTELRRLRWRDWSLDQMTEDQDARPTDFTPDALVDRAAPPDQQALQRSLFATIMTAIDEQLSDRQRLALLAVKVHGVPIEEVARELGVKRNALYKTMHDARRKLKSALDDLGLTTEEILAAFEIIDKQ